MLGGGGGGRGRTSAAAEAGMAGQPRQGRALAIADRPEASNRGREASGEDKVGDKVGLVGCLGKDVVGWRLTWAKEQGSPSHSLFPLFISLFPYLYICTFICKI